MKTLVLATMLIVSGVSGVSVASAAPHCDGNFKTTGIATCTTSK